jgi:hypothetical protein
VNYRRCLLSRKRKLSELFSITAYPLTPDDPAYKQKLQAFHDANDLTRYISRVATLALSLSCIPATVLPHLPEMAHSFPEGVRSTSRLSHREHIYSSVHASQRPSNLYRPLYRILKVLRNQQLTPNTTTRPGEDRRTQTTMISQNNRRTYPKASTVMKYMTEDSC